MTSSIPLLIFSSPTNSTAYYNKKSALVKKEFPEKPAFSDTKAAEGAVPLRRFAAALSQCSMDVTETSAESSALPIRCMAFPTVVFLAFG